jgi:hypothetical protein
MSPIAERLPPQTNEAYRSIDRSSSKPSGRGSVKRDEMLA